MALLHRLLKMPRDLRLKAISELPTAEQDALALLIKYDWPLWARPKQIAPEGDWRFWVVLAGRGFGKTRTGAEWVRSLAEAGQTRWITIVGPTREAVRKIMLRGPAGILTISPPWFEPKYEPSKLLITWPKHPETGVQCQARVYSAERPERLRGEQHEVVWADEVAAWPRPEAFEQIDMGLRLGEKPRMLITTTPRASALMVDLCLGPKGADGVRVQRHDVVVTKGRSEENSGNLARGSIESMRARYGNSRLGRQELDAELLERTGAELWTEEVIRATRVEGVPCTIGRTIIGVDPTRSDEPGDECGIVVAGLGDDGHVYILDDCSVRGAPFVWGSAAIAAYHKYRADRIVYEKNRLGSTIERTIHSLDPKVQWEPVHAHDDKEARAEPVSVLYVQGLIRHVGTFPQLEDEMTTFDPKAKQPSPNRMDAMVHAVTHLKLGETRPPLIAR